MQKTNERLKELVKKIREKTISEEEKKEYSMLSFLSMKETFDKYTG